MKQAPQPPFVAVIFSSVLSGHDPQGYDAAAGHMEQLASEQPGYLGFESVHDGPQGISISYWTDTHSAQHWGRHPEHRAIQQLGRDRWYTSYSLKVCQVDRVSDWSAEGEAHHD